MLGACQRVDGFDSAIRHPAANDFARCGNFAIENDRFLRKDGGPVRPTVRHGWLPHVGATIHVADTRIALVFLNAHIWESGTSSPNLEAGVIHRT